VTSDTEVQSTGKTFNIVSQSGSEGWRDFRSRFCRQSAAPTERDDGQLHTGYGFRPARGACVSPSLVGDNEPQVPCSADGDRRMVLPDH
jgi:hypothetical protein